MVNRLYGGHELNVAPHPGFPDSGQKISLIDQASRSKLNQIKSKALSRGFRGPKFDGFDQLLQDATETSIANAAKMLEDEGMADLAQQLRRVNLV